MYSHCKRMPTSRLALVLVGILVSSVEGKKGKRRREEREEELDPFDAYDAHAYDYGGGMQFDDGGGMQFDDGGGMQFSHLWSMIDANGNGKLSRREVRESGVFGPPGEDDALSDQSFDAIDIDGSGSISEEEFFEFIAHIEQQQLAAQVLAHPPLLLECA